MKMIIATVVILFFFQQNQPPAVKITMPKSGEALSTGVLPPVFNQRFR